MRTISRLVERLTLIKNQVSLFGPDREQFKCDELSISETCELKEFLVCRIHYFSDQPEKKCAVYLPY